MEATTPVVLQLTADEAAYIETCLARRREFLALADTVAYGKVLAECENAAVEIARQQGHRLLTDALTRRVQHAEKKGRRPASARVVRCDKAGDQTNATC